MRRAVLVPLLSVLVLGLIALAAYWWWGVRALAEGIEQWAAARRSEGYQVSLGTPETAGFPLAAVVRLGDSAIAAPGGAWTWRAKALEVRNRPWDPLSVVLSLDGDHAVSGPDGDAVAVHVETGEVALSAAPDGRLGRIAARLGRFRLDGATLGALAGRSAVVTIVSDGAAGPLPNFAVSASFDGMDLPETPAPAFGRRIERLALETRVHGALAEGPIRQALALWRDRGGLVEVRHGVLAWGPLHVSGSGALVLDAVLQPKAELETRVRGWRAALSALAEQGAVTQEDAALARVALSLMSTGTAADGGPVAELPVSVRDQRVYAGPLAIMAFPPIAWP
jgi:hypothetical protein